MERVEIVIETYNAAFDGHPSAEVKRIIREALKKPFPRSGEETSLRDINGNRVGFIRTD